MPTPPPFEGFGPLYQEGRLSIENPLPFDSGATDCTFGVQVAYDGRVWLCIDGVAWARFKPTTNLLMEDPK